ncbi:MAG: hypothetical protein DRR08_15580 [Candidatus Parabeggiatoa sp. nov. 2]|nr:MAG: hypothetical protein DRR08_15580 [Gammaproteobacteria bacterium]HEC85959.1 hypothetical protein [Thioploca sp.]
MLMNHFKINLLLITLVVQFIPTTALAAGKHALLIGIQDYSKTPFNSLKGPPNDIELTKGVLRERFGFSEDNLTILLDAQATHTGIEKAFKALIKRVQADDFVYIHYSGHGSQTADLNGDEKNGKDQTWVSYGARSSNEAHKDNYDVLDDEINAWLAALYAKTEKVVFVSDSCHSATVSRAVRRGEALVRAVEEDKRPHLLGKRPYSQLTTSRGIRVGAARDNESAIDNLKKGSLPYGLFTWHWVHNLQKAQAGETWNDVFKRTYAQVTIARGIAQRPYMQQPQIEGDRRKRVLGGDFTPLPPTVPVLLASKSWVGIQAGSTAGVTKGSVYRLYRPTESNPQTLPRLTITKVTPFVSYGRPKPKGSFQLGDLLVEENHAYHFTPIKVYLEADFPNGKDRPLLQAIRAAFQPNAYGTQPLSAYRLSNDPSDIDLRLQLLRPKRQDGQQLYASPSEALPKSFPDQPPELWILTAEQRLFKKDIKIQFYNPTEAVKLLQRILKQMARVRELKALQSHRGRTLPVAVQTYLLSPVSTCRNGANCVLLSDYGLGWHRKTGPYPLSDIEELSKEVLVTFSLHNQSKQDYYCYLINISPNDAIYAIFPDPYERMESARIKAEEKRELMTEVVLPMNEIGENIIQVITTTYPIDISLLEQPPLRNEKKLNPVEQLLLNAAHGRRGNVSTPTEEWAMKRVSFEVK